MHFILDSIYSHHFPEILDTTPFTAISPQVRCLQLILVEPNLFTLILIPNFAFHNSMHIAISYHPPSSDTS
jgi:hypothetical protein